MAKVTDKSRWDEQYKAVGRAKREAVSAPRKKDLLIYEKYLRQSIKGVKTPRVLILGATPELRDLALKYHCETISTDISWSMIVSLTEVMEHQGDPLDRPMLYDWLDLDKIFKPCTFDAILADASINNISPKYHNRILNTLRNLLKKHKSLIMRHGVLDSSYKGDVLELLQSAYNKRQIDWLEFYWCLIMSFQKNIKIAPHQYSIKKFNKIFKQLLSKNKIKFRKEDLYKIDNVLKVAKDVVHTIFDVEQFDKMAAKYFKVAKQSSIKNKNIKWIYIYNLVVKK